MHELTRDALADYILSELEAQSAKPSGDIPAGQVRIRVVQKDGGLDAVFIDGTFDLTALADAILTATGETAKLAAAIREGSLNQPQIRWFTRGAITFALEQAAAVCENPSNRTLRPDELALVIRALKDLNESLLNSGNAAEESDER